MVPVICGCKEQKYSYVPGVVNVKVNLSSVSSGMDLNCVRWHFTQTKEGPQQLAALF